MSTVLTLVALFVVPFAALAFPLFRPRFKDYVDEGELPDTDPDELPLRERL